MLAFRVPADGREASVDDTHSVTWAVAAHVLSHGLVAEARRRGRWYTWYIAYRLSKLPLETARLRVSHCRGQSESRGHAQFHRG